MTYDGAECGTAYTSSEPSSSNCRWKALHIVSVPGKCLRYFFCRVYFVILFIWTVFLPSLWLLAQATMLRLIQKCTLKVVTELWHSYPLGWVLDDCVKGECFYFLWSLRFHSFRLSSCLSISGEPDMKSRVALVTDSMWIQKCLWQIFLCYCPKTFLCKMLSQN
jgi:hypothetical protein